MKFRIANNRIELMIPSTRQIYSTLVFLVKNGKTTILPISKGLNIINMPKNAVLVISYVTTRANMRICVIKDNRVKEYFIERGKKVPEELYRELGIPKEEGEYLFGMYA